MTETDSQDSEVRMSLGDHLEELRRRLIYAILGIVGGMVIGLVVARQVIVWMEKPYHTALERLGLPREPLAVMTLGGGFDIYMKTALWVGVILSSPWILYQLWAFVSAGLLPKEKRGIHFAFPFSVVLFLAGAAMFYFAVAVPAMEFLLYFDAQYFGTNGGPVTRPVITFANYLGFVAEMLIVFGIAFQTPLIVLALAKIGLVSMKTLRKYRRHAVLIAMVFSAIFAPADVGSMLVLAAAIWLLYELGVVFSYYLVLRRRKEEEGEELGEEVPHSGEDPVPTDEGESPGN